MTNQKLRLAVFFGGRSVEHGVSIVTAAQVMGQADRGRYDVIPVYATEGGEYYVVPDFDVSDFTGLPLNPSAFDAFAKSKGRRAIVGAEKGRLLTTMSRGLTGERLSPLEVDVAFSIVHGSHGEDGTLQGVFELADVPYVGPNLVPAAVAMDKIAAKALFKGLGLPTVEGVWFDRAAWQADQASVVAQVRELGLPVFVKPASLGSSIGVARVNEDDDEYGLAFAVDTVLNYDRRCVVEQAVPDGMDINCAVMRGADGGVRVSQCERPVKDEEVLDYAAKYLRGSKQEGMAAARRVFPADIPDEVAARVRSMAETAYTQLSMRGLARIDFLVSPTPDWPVYINEINAIPGSMATYFWELEGMKASEVIDLLIADAQSAHREKQRTIYSLSQVR
jgi:D-alanine-D-alanine ligase